MIDSDFEDLKVINARYWASINISNATMSEEFREFVQHMIETSENDIYLNIIAGFTQKDFDNWEQRAATVVTGEY